MELNITILIQISIFFSVFVFLSNILFFSLEKISINRNSQVLFQKKNIEYIKKDIYIHKKYINNMLKVTTDKTLKIHYRITCNIAKKNIILHKIFKVESKKII